MPDQRDDDNCGEAAGGELLPPLLKTYIDQQIQKFSESDERSRKKKWKNSWRSASPITKGTFILAAAVAVATVAYSFIAGFQLRVMGSQLAEMKHVTNASLASTYAACVATQVSRGALIEVERGEVYADEAAQAARVQAIMATRSQVAYIIPLFQSPIRLITGAPIQYPFNLKNVGNSAAKNILVHFRVLLLPRDEDPSFTYPPGETGLIDTPQLAAGESPSSLNLSGGSYAAKLDREGHRSSFTTEDVKEISEHRKDIMFFARITYNDMAGVHHWRNVCRVGFNIEPVGGASDMVSHDKCIHYNQEDQNSGFPNHNEPSLPISQVPQIDCPLPEYEK
jgi:hypothetical protein